MRKLLMLSVSAFSLTLSATPAFAAAQHCYPLLGLTCPDELVGDHDSPIQTEHPSLPERPDPPPTDDDDDTDPDDDDDTGDDDDCPGDNKTY